MPGVGGFGDFGVKGERDEGRGANRRRVRLIPTMPRAQMTGRIVFWLRRGRDGGKEMRIVQCIKSAECGCVTTFPTRIPNGLSKDGGGSCGAFSHHSHLLLPLPESSQPFLVARVLLLDGRLPASLDELREWPVGDHVGPPGEHREWLHRRVVLHSPWRVAVRLMGGEGGKEHEVFSRLVVRQRVSESLGSATLDHHPHQE